MLRVATIGSSQICVRFLDAVATSPDVEYVATYSRELSRARSFGEKRGASLFFDSIEGLARCADVDAVYVASPNACHAAQALELVAAGKHVLVEKSLASNEREASEVFAAAHKNGVVCMETMRNLHVPGFAAIERTLPELGPVRKATFRFSKVTSRMVRLRAGERLNVFDPALAGGALLDMGVYCVEPAVALFGAPSEVRAVALTAPVPGEPAQSPYATCDLAGEVLLGYGDKIVSLSYGKMSDDQLPSQIEGEGATLVWDQCSCPVNLRVYDHEDKGLVFKVGGEARPVDVEPTPENDMICELSTFAAACAGDPSALAACERFETVTLQSLRVMDEVRRQIGVSFPADAR